MRGEKKMQTIVLLYNRQKKNKAEIEIIMKMMIKLVRQDIMKYLLEFVEKCWENIRYKFITAESVYFFGSTINDGVAWQIL
jgi:hypothetical protein